MSGGSANRLSDAAHIAQSLELPEQFSAIFERHSTAVFKFLARQVDSGAAADLLAETFLVAFRSRAKYDTAYEDARGWLFGIAVNVARHHRRSFARRRALQARIVAEVATAPDDEATIDHRLGAVAAQRQIAAALEELKPLHREVLLLSATDLDYEEIAQALHVPVGTVRSRLSRARGRMRELVCSGGQPQVTADDEALLLAPTREKGGRNA